MPSIFGCLSETYFRCCEQWFCFDKKIALYTSNDSFGPNSYGKSHDQTTIPVVWSGKDLVPVAAAPMPVIPINKQPEVITEEPKVNSEPKLNFEDANAEETNKDTNKEEIDEEERKERRKSASEIKLTIHDYEHDHRTDIPVIRQQNVPKFYIGTPERTEFDWNQKPKSIFEQQQDQLAKEMNPHLTAFHFNLKTIRDMNLEPLPQQRALAASAKEHDNSSFSKLFNFKTKFKAFSHQKRTGSKSVPNFPIYS